MDVKHAQAEAAAQAVEQEAAQKAAEEAATAPGQEEAQKTANAEINNEMDLGDGESAPPKGPPTTGTVPQENTMPVTPNPKDGAPAASERSAGQGA